MQKHARASKIAHIFQTRDERRVRGRREGKGEQSISFFKPDEHQALSPGPLKSTAMLGERTTDPALTLITMIGRFN